MRPTSRPLTLGLTLSVAAAGVMAGCNAGRIRAEIGQQIRQIRGQLRGASPRERYADALRDAGPDGAVLARDWIAAGDRALGAPAAAPLPLREQGAFDGAEPAAALAWRVRPHRGERVTLRVDAAADSGARLFTELWREDAGARTLVESGEGPRASYDVRVDDAEAVYVLRIQPELRGRVRWTLALGAGPSLAFPVAGKDVRAVASGFGAARDGGARAHEGVDIMAKRGTPAVAAEDGVVRYVGDDRLGGRVVSIASGAGGHALYYAHLDSQTVHAGQAVRTGDTVGFVGNTGNARGGPPHLHFGVYRNDGAVDPLPYLDDRRHAAGAPGRDTLFVGRPVRTASRATAALRAGPGADAPTLALLAPRTALAVDGAAGGGWLHVRLPAAPAGAVAGYPTTGYVAAGAIEPVSAPAPIPAAPVPAAGVAATRETHGE